LPDDENAALFDREIAPHLAAAYNLARWLTGSAPDAEDVMQDACLRAFRFAARVRSGPGKAWLYQIVRNCSYTALGRRRESHRELDAALLETADPTPTAEARLANEATAEELRAALERLPVEFREALILREWEELSYREIAEITDVPEGTVMSRLARARQHLRRELEGQERSKHASRNR